MRFRSSILTLGLIVCTALLAIGQGMLLPTFEETFSGTAASLWIAKPTQLNQLLDDAGYPLLPDTCILTGQTSVFRVAGPLRVGFATGSGSASAERGDRAVTVDYAVSSGHVEWEYRSGRHVGLSLGLGLGVADVTVSLVDHMPASLLDALQRPSRARLERRMVTVEPWILASLPLTDGIMFRAQLGYLTAIGRQWRIEGIAHATSTDGLCGPTLSVAVAVDWERLQEQLLGSSEKTEITPQEDAP